jgi:hypothetical protein
MEAFHARVVELKEEDEVKLSLFPAEPIPIQMGRKTVSNDLVYCAFEPVTPLSVSVNRAGGP